MKLDTDEINAVADAVAARLTDHLRQIAAEQSRAAATAGSYAALHDIIGISADAARMRLTRDPELKALGVLVGDRLRFRRDQVEALFRERAKAKTPK